MDLSKPFTPRGDKKQLEESAEFSPKFDSDGLIPALAMDANTKEPLMLAYMNQESLRMSLEIGEAVYWSRSRQEIWHKGATPRKYWKYAPIVTRTLSFCWSNRSVLEPAIPAVIPVFTARSWALVKMAWPN